MVGANLAGAATGAGAAWPCNRIPTVRTGEEAAVGGEEEKGKRLLWRCSVRTAVPKARGRSDAEEHGDPGAEGGGEGSAAAERIFWREL
jgi:hypothetical protein